MVWTPVQVLVLSTRVQASPSPRVYAVRCPGPPGLVLGVLLRLPTPSYNSFSPCCPPTSTRSYLPQIRSLMYLRRSSLVFSSAFGSISNAWTRHNSLGVSHLGVLTVLTGCSQVPTNHNECWQVQHGIAWTGDSGWPVSPLNVTINNNMTVYYPNTPSKTMVLTQSTKVTIITIIV